MHASLRLRQAATPDTFVLDHVDCPTGAKRLLVPCSLQVVAPWQYMLSISMLSAAANSYTGKPLQTSVGLNLRNLNGTLYLPSTILNLYLTRLLHRVLRICF